MLRSLVVLAAVRRRLPRRPTTRSAPRSPSCGEASFPTRKPSSTTLSDAGHPSTRAGADRDSRGSSVRPQRGQGGLHRHARPRAPTASSTLVDPVTLQGRRHRRRRRADEDRHQQPPAAASADDGAPGLRWRTPTPRSACRRWSRCCARSTRRASSCCAARAVGNGCRRSRPRSTPALALAALDGDRSRGAARAPSQTLAGRTKLGGPQPARRAAREGRGRHASPSPTSRSARRPRRRSRRSIDTARFYSGIETLFFGLSLGSVLVLVAIGLAITFGVMGVINMAHGELMMLGAYTTYVVQLLMPQHIGIVDPGGDSRGVPRRRDSPACCSSARSSAFSTAGRSRRCSRRSASAWCCSSWCGRSSRRTTARSRRRRG